MTLAAMQLLFSLIKTHGFLFISDCTCLNQKHFVEVVNVWIECMLEGFLVYVVVEHGADEEGNFGGKGMTAQPQFQIG